ncbi:hypothetical protein MAPG_08807 [Magnaporthiopsis poae ATCC 64411]|uniref:amidase n=1 Tax=Magnaporthiopsis poae (strain ATCC 64411 / 73-15) TaxID=644358 RepID=A0A0C4E8A7_MAGP6|nr:hypothetical protein MAPG_08807 [Magnaporthiopsis poae ATCC 64411]
MADHSSDQQPAKAATKPWADVVAAKRAIRDEHVQKHSHADSDANLAADVVDIETLTGLLESGKVSAEQLIRAYIARACEAQHKTNCLTEICFNDAIEQARQLDDFQRTHGRLMGPLHGVPVSLKDQFNVKGLDSTLGYVGRASAPAQADGTLVQTLKQFGAVIIAKTNLPQSIMWCETDNPLWGLTSHPVDVKLTPGGSSGGEAALLSLGGSLIGWGTDIGGSIRIPSHMNGLWGLKPSSGRLSYRGVEVSLDGQQHIPSAVGPMARSLKAITTVTKLTIDAAPWTTDPQLPPIPWRQEEYEELSTRPLVVGALLDDGVVRVHPPIERVFRDVVAKLKEAGHEFVEWDWSLHSKCVDVMDGYYACDGGEDIRRAVAAGGEPFVPQIQAFVNRGPAISVHEYWQLNRRKVALQQAYHDMWDATRAPSSGRPVDVLLVPAMPHTACRTGRAAWPGLPGAG